MVMSGNGESVVFVHGRRGDESWLTGGTIARLRSAGTPVLLLIAEDSTELGVTTPDGPDRAAAERDAELEAAVTALGALDVRLIPAIRPAASVATPAVTEAGAAIAGAPTEPTEAADESAHVAARGAYLSNALREAWATAVVVGAVDERVREAAVRAAHDAGIPAFLTRGVADGVGQRLTAIDVSDQVDAKRAALAAYRSRWTVEGRTLVLPGGTRHAITGAETYSRLDAPHAPLAAPPPAFLTRLAAGALGLGVGVVFAVLGTIAHQATLEIGMGSQSVSLPVGLFIALTAACALLVGLRLVLRDRLVVGLTAAGLLLTSFVLSLRSIGGSVLVPEGLPGTLWTVVPAFVAALVLAWPTFSVTRRTR